MWYFINNKISIIQGAEVVKIKKGLFFSILSILFGCNLLVNFSSSKNNAKEADAVLEMFNANASKYHKDYCPDMKAYKIGRVEYAKGEVNGQKDAVLFED